MTCGDSVDYCGLYIHIPFCLRKCSYCDFASYKVDSYDTSRYCDAVVREIELIFFGDDRVCGHGDSLFAAGAAGLVPDTVYIGGGTPTVLPVDQLAKVIKAAKRATMCSGRLDRDIELTVEANPGTLTAEYLLTLRELGVNRLSIGLQSTSDKYLSMLGRVHSYRDFVESYRLAALAGFQNISVDLIYGLPGQSLEEWREDLTKVTELAIPHVSCYSLTLCEGTPMFDNVTAGRLKEPPEDLVADMYFEAVSTLTKSGYSHYEISNYALPGMECRHNLGYWENRYYIGIGAAAHSHLKGFRCANTADVGKYIDRIEAGVLGPEYVESISRRRELSDSFILGLRTAAGVDIEELSRRFSPEAVAEFTRSIEEFADVGLVEFANGRVRLTERGMILSNEVMAKLL